MQILKIHLNRLINLRNKILNILKSLDTVSKEGGIHTCYSKKDFLAIINSFRKLEMAGYLSPHKLWGIKVKHKETENYEDAEYTDVNL